MTLRFSSARLSSSNIFGRKNLIFRSVDEQFKIIKEFWTKAAKLSEIIYYTANDIKLKLKLSIPQQISFLLFNTLLQQYNL